MQKFQIEKKLAFNCSKWEIEFTQINCQRKNAFPKNLQYLALAKWSFDRKSWNVVN